MAEEKEDLIKKAIKEAQEAAQTEAEENLTEEEILTDNESEMQSDMEEDTDASEDKCSTRENRKKEKLGRKKEKDKSKEKIDELEDKVKRQLAEFENFRTRSEKEKSMMFDMGAKSVLEKILPVVDNFERGLQTITTSEDEKPFADGMNMIYKQLMSELEKLGVKPIEAVGKEFNPDFHNAVMQVESEEFETGFVAQELQKGYMYRDTVIRHSMVAVVQ